MNEKEGGYDFHCLCADAELAWITKSEIKNSSQKYVSTHA
jgi:hypothetical protein